MERTVVQFSSQFPKISQENSLVFIGSCFSSNIGGQLQNRKINSVVNPFGTLFHPDAIARLLLMSLQEKEFIADDFFERDGYWFSYWLGANSGKETIDEAVESANQNLLELKTQLQNASLLVLTLGTAYSHQMNGDVVANCHKMPSNKFDKKLSSLDDLKKVQEELIQELFLLNSDLKIQYTVSPVRHVKEGLVNNNKSKSLLLLTIQELEKDFSQVEYLPVYELVMDELRDYSFFKSDLIHLNQRGVSYVFDRFCNWMLANETIVFMESIEKIQRQYNHESLYPKSPSNQQFLRQLIKDMKAHQNEFGVLWETEIQAVKKKLENLE